MRTLSSLFKQFIVTDWNSQSTDGWTADLQKRARNALLGNDLLSELAMRTHLTHHNKGYAYIDNGNINDGVMLLVDKKSGVETADDSVESVIRDGWVID